MNPTNEPQKTSEESTPPTAPRAPREEQETLGAFAEAKQKIKAVTQDTTRQIKTTASQAASEAQRAAAQRKEDVAARVDRYGAAVHQSAESLEGEDPNIAWLTHQAADRLQGVADYVRRSDFTALRRDAENLARRHPAVFFGGLFVAGLLLGNVMKASGRPSGSNRDTHDDQDQNKANPPGLEYAPEDDVTTASRAQAEEV